MSEAELLDELKRLQSCTHRRAETRSFTMSNGVVAFRVQCLECGSPVGNWIKREMVQGEPPKWDDTLQNRRTETWDALQQLRNEMFANKRDVRRAQYAEYLGSDEWQDRRQRVLERDNYLCQACLKARATQVHHKTYEHVFNEPLFDLESVCRECHELLHDENALISRLAGAA